MSAGAPGKSGAGYELAKPLGRCRVCDKPIEVGQRFMAALRETPQGLERLDVSLDCWQDFDRKEVLAFWQSVMPSADQKRRLFVDDQVLCELFERLSDASEQSKVNFRFVLGLILMRKRLVIYESTEQHEGREVWTVRLKGREDRIDLTNPRLDEQQIKEVSEQIGQILSEEL
ncbi:MAG: hypothetical protein ACREJC_00435 [Tepidisphaeraceae bacterium]